MPQVRRIGEINQWINKEISQLLLQSRRADLRVQRDVFKILEYFVGSSGTISGDTKAAITSLVRDMMERYSFTEMYREKMHNFDCSY